MESLHDTLVLQRAKRAVSEALTCPADAPVSSAMKSSRRGSERTARREEARAVNMSVEAVRQSLDELGLSKAIRLAVYARDPAAEYRPREAAETHSSVHAARRTWEGSINEELEAIARERCQPLQRARAPGQAPSVQRAVENSGGYSAPLRFLFDSEDLLDAIANIESPMVPPSGPGAGAGAGAGNGWGGGGAPAASSSAAGRTLRSGREVALHEATWGVIKLSLKTPTLEALRVTFADLDPSKRQYGIDEGSEEFGDRFVDEWHALGKRCTDQGHVPVARRFARRGVPPGLRPQVWRALAGLPDAVSDAERIYYAQLRAHVDRVDLVTDDLFAMDVQHVADDDSYFPFEETLLNVVLAFSRDEWVPDHSAIQTHTPLSRGAMAAPTASRATKPAAGGGPPKASEIRKPPPSTGDDVSKQGAPPAEDGKAATPAPPPPGAPAMTALHSRNAAAPSHHSNAKKKKNKPDDDDDDDDSGDEHTSSPSATKPTRRTHSDAVPPCAVHPFRGFINYAAPLTFLYRDDEPVFFMLRAMYCRYWCRLNVLRTQPDTLLPLCKLFETLLADEDPKLFFHLIQIGVDPIAIALPWIQFAFVTLLAVDQVLLLWDRLLGFDDLALLPVLAAAVFVYRSKTLLTAETMGDVKEMFSDGSILDVAPLLQHFLFAS